MKTAIGGLTDEVLANPSWTAGDARDAVYFYLDFDSDTSGTLQFLKTTDDVPTSQMTYNDVSSGKNLLGKVAGNDEKGQHKDWSKDFEGWGAKGSVSPEALIDTWVGMLDDQAVRFATGNAPKDPWGNTVPGVHVTPQGQDLQQLLQKFTRMAIAFSQAADDYLDDDTTGKGLMATHATATDGKNYSDLEHAWDEGFGYFGANTTYLQWSDAENKTGYHDVNGDGTIDLMTEVNFGHALNAAKRDAGSTELTAPTDYTKAAWDGFAKGRKLLSDTEGELTDAQMSKLKAHRDMALDAWEKAVAATVVHYINDTLQDMGKMGTSDYDFGTHAKHWSEMKGFALGLQFNRFSPVSDADFGTLHEYMGTAPVLTGDAELTAYKQALLDARDLLQSSYGFDAGNMGDDNGENGW